MTMPYPEDQIAELKDLCPGLMLASEGGIDYLYMPALPMPEGCTPATIDALLCPTPRDGYPSRLFFAQKVTPKKPPNPPLNWNAQNVRILEKNWHGISWKIRPGLRLAQTLSAHLTALR